MEHHKEELPWELIEETLSHVSPITLVRFGTVCKQWKSLLDDKRFIKNHKSTFRFILTTNSKIYSVSIDPEVVVHELTLDVPGLEEPHIPKRVFGCDEFVLCRMDKGAVVWNPWLNQTTLIETESKVTHPEYFGLGYDHMKNYKIFCCGLWLEYPPTNFRYKIFDFASDSWKDYYASSPGDSRHSSNNDQEPKPSGVLLIDNASVSLNGCLYWVASLALKDNGDLFIVRLDFSSERLTKCVYLPCGKNHLRDALRLGVFKGDRFSLLKQCYVTKKIEVWVTKNKVNNHGIGEDEVWIKVVEVSDPNLHGFVCNYPYHQPSYFVEDKRLVVCFCDENGRPWIYVVERNKVITKTQLSFVVDPWPLHCTYTPGLVPVPIFQRKSRLLNLF